MNISLAAIKAIGGFFFRSQALIADAVDSTGDLLTDVITLLAVRVAGRPIDRNHPYGHGRFESLAAMVIALFLLAAAGSIAYKAIHSLLHGPKEFVRWPAIVVALLSVATKETLFRWTRGVARRIHSRVIEANAYHHRSDAFSSIAVLIGVTGALIIPNAQFLDAVASLAVTVFIIRTAIRIGLASVHDLVDTQQDPDFLKQAKEVALSVPEVLHAHRLRSRRYGSLIYMDLDIEVRPEMTVEQGHHVAHDVKDLILEKFDNVADVLIHVEPEGSHLEGEGTIRGMETSGKEIHA